MPTRAEYVKYLRSLEGGYGPARGLRNNDNPYNTWYYGRRVSGDNYAWCAVTECYVENHFGILEINGGKVSYVPNMVSVARHAGAKVWHRPHSVPAQGTSWAQPGNKLCYDFNRTGEAEHTGTFVKRLSSTRFLASEGNTSTSRYSDALAPKERSVADVLDVIELLGVSDHPTPKPQEDDDMFTDNGELLAASAKTNVSFPHGLVRAVGLARDEPTVAEVRVAFHYKAGRGEVYDLKVGGPKSGTDAWPAKTVQSFKRPADGDWMSITWTNPEAGGSVGWDVS
ncbi:MAG: hypothetical protein ACRDP6_42255 [Actinoallomurus sp.]